VRCRRCAMLLPGILLSGCHYAAPSPSVLLRECWTSWREPGRPGQIADAVSRALDSLGLSVHLEPLHDPRGLRITAGPGHPLRAVPKAPDNALFAVQLELTPVNGSPADSTRFGLETLAGPAMARFTSSDSIAAARAAQRLCFAARKAIETRSMETHGVGSPVLGNATGQTFIRASFISRTAMFVFVAHRRLGTHP
jgi:hypothetical protein